LAVWAGDASTRPLRTALRKRRSSMLLCGPSLPGFHPNSVNRSIVFLEYMLTSTRNAHPRRRAVPTAPPAAPSRRTRARSVEIVSRPMRSSSSDTAS